MSDQNVFAFLTARDETNKASSAFSLPHNARWFCKALGGVAEEPCISSREPTPAPQLQSLENDLDTADRLVVGLDAPLKDPLEGIQFGTNPRVCDILLGHRGTGGISARQYNITVDDNLWIWLHDYRSTHGSGVGYNTEKLQEVEVHKKETWILAYGPGTPNIFRDITICSGGLAIKIEFPNHAAADPQYIANLRAFLEKTRRGVPQVDGLGLESESTTAAPSQPRTPSERTIYFDVERIGKGAFGEVSKAIKTRDGKQVAIKRFFLPKKRKRNEDEPAWREYIRTEFAIMRDNPHANIMRVFEFRETPEPFIVMDYYEQGNISDAQDLKDSQYVTACGQILDGLVHLHAQGVAHRDLKPENILVKKVAAFTVVITDFGMSKVVTETSPLKTFCGTLTYTAPEVFPGQSHGHGPLRDVWALGVMTYQWLYGIPDVPDAPGPVDKIPPYLWGVWLHDWLKRLLNKLADEHDDLAVDILQVMLQRFPEQRCSAAKCQELGLQNGLFRRRAIDGLIENAHEVNLQAEEVDNQSRTRTNSGTDSGTIILGCLWNSSQVRSGSEATEPSNPVFCSSRRVQDQPRRPHRSRHRQRRES